MKYKNPKIVITTKANIVRARLYDGRELVREVRVMDNAGSAKITDFEGTVENALEELLWGQEDDDKGLGAILDADLDDLV